MRTRLVGGLWVATALALSAPAACVDDPGVAPADSAPAQGSEGGPCFSNGTCDTALVCMVPNVCAKPGADGGVGSSDSSPAMDSSADTSAADTSVGDAADAAPPTPPSCATPGDGRNNCGGTGAESCCTSLAVAGGTYNRTFVSDAGAPTGGVDPATVGDFKLDKYEVTVGRFREFVAAWNAGAGWTPPTGSGKHTHLNGGNGLNATAGGFEAGWVAIDTANIAPTAMNLACDATYATWTIAPGANEARPITCENWYELAAFCIWDGGFLPSEAEWEYATVGGSEDRQYPWGTTAPGTANLYAIYGCFFPSSSGSCSGATNIAPVGTPTAGAGKYGQLDLAGNAYEWNHDWYKSPYVSCTNCVNTTPSTGRLMRGGAFDYPTNNFNPTSRASVASLTRNGDLGGRCARTP